MKKKLILMAFVAFLGTITYLTFGRSEDASAAVCTNPGYATDNPTNRFPRPLTGMRENAGCVSSDTFVWLSRYWASSTVEVPTANFRVFYDINQINAQPWDFDVITFETLGTGNHLCGSRIEITLPQSGWVQQMYRNPSATCAIQMPAGFIVNKGMLQSDPKYGANIRYIDLNMEQLTASSNAPIRVVSSSPYAKITFRENDVNALWSYSNNASAQDPTTYVLNFQPDCNYAANQVFNINLEWFDADVGAPPQGAIVFTMFLVDDTAGVHVTPPGGLRSDSYPFGGDDADGSWNVNLTGGHRYRWIWSNIARSNGIQIRMPFSEINSDPSATCFNNQTPSGSFGITCDAGGSGVLTVTTNASDPDGGNVTVTANVPGANPGSRTGSGSGGINLNGGNTFQGTPGGTYTVSGSVVDDENTSGPMSSPPSVTCPVPMVTIQGRVFDAFHPSALGRGNVGITTCVPGNPVVYTDGSGNFQFQIPQGTWFCIRADYNLPAGTVGVHVKPYGPGYPQCGATQPAYGYCQARNYEGQLAGLANANGYDRFGTGTYDYGYDVVLTYRPTISCTVANPGAFEAGVPNNYTPSAQVSQAADNSAPPSVTGTTTLSYPGGSTAGTYTDSKGGAAANVTFSPASVTVNPIGTFTPSMTANGSYGPGQWWQINAVGTSCSSSQPGVAGDEPYFKIYGSDVWAGGSFSGVAPCAPDAGNGGVYGFVRQTTENISGSNYPRYGGASAQFTVASLLSVGEFYSVSHRWSPNGNTFPAKGLTFANTAGTYGGNFGAGGHCITNYYDETRAQVTGDLDIQTRTDQTAYPFPPAPVVTPAPPPVPQRMFMWTSGGGADDSNPPVFADYPYCFRFDASSTDPHTWNDNWLCSRYPLNNLRWYIRPTSSTPFPTPFYSQIYEPGDDYVNTGWDRRYFMIADTNPGFNITWIYNSAADPSIPAGQPGARGCTRVHELVAGESAAWTDNWLCADWVQAPVLGSNVALTASSITRSSAYNSEYEAAFPGNNLRDGRYGASVGGNPRGEWASAGQLGGAWVRFTWSSPVTIGRVSLYDRPNPTDHVRAGEIRFSSGAPVRFDELPNNGLQPSSITFPSRTTTYVEIYITSAVGANIGLAEVTIEELVGPSSLAGAFPSGRNQYVLPANTNKSITDPISIPVGSQIALYVDGDVWIEDNITLATGAASRANMPYFAMIVKGNIYIGKDVTRLDGLYVAQPDGASGGKIYTCAEGMNDQYEVNELYGNCRNRQLAFNGSVVAKQVKWQRTANSLRDSVFSTPANRAGEVPDFNTGLGGNIRAAEVINYTPEMYMAPSPLSDPEDWAGKYDAITGLPPIY